VRRALPACLSTLQPIPVHLARPIFLAEMALSIALGAKTVSPLEMREANAGSVRKASSSV